MSQKGLNGGGGGPNFTKKVFFEKNVFSEGQKLTKKHGKKLRLDALLILKISKTK